MSWFWGAESADVGLNYSESDQQRVVMRYRCGWCGRPTLEDGTPMPLIEVGLIDDIDGEYKDAEKVNGGCCG